MKMKLSGVTELKKDLLNQAKMEVVKTAVKYHTASLTEKAQRRVPVDTGFLKRSIIQEISDGGMTGTITAGADYAGYVEKGTRFMEAQPYMEPSFNEVKPAFIKDLERIKK